MLEMVWGKENPPNIVVECKLMQNLWRILWRFLKILNIELAYDPATSHLGIYAEKTVIQKDTLTPVFIVELFTIAKTWKQSKCPLVDEWIKKMWYIQRMKNYSAIKTNSFATKLMDLQIVILSEISHTKKRQMLYNTEYMYYLKKWYKYIFTKQIQSYRLR